MASTPDDLARLLCIYSIPDGEDPPCLLDTEENRFALVDVYEEICLWTPQGTTAFFAEFNSKYLPLFLKQCLVVLDPLNIDIESWTSIGSMLAICTPDLVYLPSISTSTLTKIDTVLGLLELQPFIATDEDKLGDLKLLDLMVHRATIKGSDARTRLLESEGPYVWLKCEVTPDDGSTCHPLPPGEEMQACGRCRSVRYCSKEHQKEDWKTHKSVCFAPTW
ncbi:hypothetical protein BDY24DRAFT_438036 [Mrakia frigida]|uniref:zinc finger MYND domain-containing protein n=1 Tax=Mrakia frigida TaxID=29902 RepID=UPI003FCBF8EC